MPNEIEGTQGWKQFLTAKKELLHKFDKTLTQIGNRPVKTAHGWTAEAAYRDWLGEFLPKRYGVTSGYVISSQMDDKQDIRNYDVLVYDRINSPTLWVEEDGASDRGHRIRAIPAEHVYAVIEVKSAFQKETINAALDHIRTLAPLLDGEDSPHERYKTFLPRDFQWACVFFELREKHADQLENLELFADTLRGNAGALILRGEGRQEEDAGFIRLWEEGPDWKDTESISLLNGRANSGSLRVGPRETRMRASLLWMPASFSMFTFDLLSRLNGNYDPKKLSSFHAFPYPKLAPPGTPEE